jgi:hypothetical protein
LVSVGPGGKDASNRQTNTPDKNRAFREGV